ncbi:hypothetical protein Tco_1085573 [Tanacetum coccineum]
MYVEYLKEFWYIAEVEEETKTITFLLSWWDKPISFTQDEFVSAIGLPICKDVVPLPPKETVTAGLATLGLFDKDKPTLSSIVLIDIGGIIFSDLVNKLQNEKKNMKLNICYTTFLSLMFENLLGKDYASNDLTIVKPHTITTASFQKPLASEVSLTSHTLKVAKFSKEPEQSLLPPFGEVNADDTADKSLSKAFVQHVTQSKATTDMKTKKKKIPPSSKPKSPYQVSVILSKKQVAETQHAEVTVATADATKSLEASELAEEQGNPPSTVEAKKLLDEADKLNKVVQEIPESPYDIESEIKVVKSFFTSHISELKDQTMHDSKEIADFHEGSDSDLQSMPDDDMRSVSGFHTTDFEENAVSNSDNIFQDDHASAERLSLPDHMDHICEEVSSLHSRLGDMESSIVQQVSSEIKSSLPNLITDSLKDQLPSLLSDALKDTLPPLLKDSIRSSISQSIAEELPHVEAQVQKNLHDQLPTLLLKLMYKEFNAFNKLESQRFVILEKELSKSLHKNMKKSIRLKEKNNPAEEKGAQHPDQIKGDQLLGVNSVDNVQGEQPSARGILNDEKSLVVHNPEEKKEGTDVLKPEEQHKSLHDFTNQLFGTTSSKFSPTPPREPTPHRDLVKGKEVAIVKEQGTLSLEEYNNQIRELKRISDLKAQQDKSEQELRKIYVVNSNKEATMKITRGDNPLNLIVHPNFRLKSLGFSEWLEAKKLGLSPPPTLATFGMTTEEKKRKRTQFLKEAFVTEDIRVDGMNKNLIPPPGVVPIEGLLIRIQNQIKVDSEIADEMFRKMIYVIEARSDCIKARETVEKNLDNLG